MLAKKDDIDGGELKIIYDGLSTYNGYKKGNSVKWLEFVVTTYISIDKKDIQFFVWNVQDFIFFVSFHFVSILIDHIFVIARSVTFQNGNNNNTRHNNVKHKKYEHDIRGINIQPSFY